MKYGTLLIRESCGLLELKEEQYTHLLVVEGGRAK